MRAKTSYIKCLERRLEFLTASVEQAPDKQLNFIKSEIASLSWAIPILKNKVQSDKDAKGF